MVHGIGFAAPNKFFSSQSINACYAGYLSSKAIFIGWLTRYQVTIVLLHKTYDTHAIYSLAPAMQ
jgi:hypothetical protein